MAPPPPDPDPSPSGPAPACRVLWLIKGLGPGGAERLLVHQAAAGSSRVRYEVAYLVAAKDQLVEELAAVGVEATCWPTRSALDLRWLARLRQRLRRGDVDVVHVHSPLVAGLARPVVRSMSRRRRPALVYTEHNRWSQYTLPTRWLNRATYRLDDWQIAVSDGVRDSVPAARRSGLETLVHGIDLDVASAGARHRDEVRARWAIPHDTVVVGTVANLRVEKGYADLVRAVALVDPDLPVTFVAIGQGPLAAEIAAQVTAAGLGGRFRLLGYQPDAVGLMAAFDLFVLASHHEGLPVAVMEALASGLPVVATRVGGLPEAVEHERTGLLVAPRRPPELAAAVERLVRDASERSRLGEAAARASRRFDRTESTRRIEAGYLALAGR